MSIATAPVARLAQDRLGPGPPPMPRLVALIRATAPSIVAAFASSGTELTAAMALIQTFTVVAALAILFRLTRGVTRELT